MSYYTINEEAARTANDLNSHYMRTFSQPCRRKWQIN